MHDVAQGSFGRAVYCCLAPRSEATGSVEKNCEIEAARTVAPTGASLTRNKDDADAEEKHEGGNVLVAGAVESSVKCQLKALDAKPAALF